MTNSLLSNIPSKRNPLGSYKVCTISSRLLQYLDGNQALDACQVHQLQPGLSGCEAVGKETFPSKSDAMRSLLPWPELDLTSRTVTPTHQILASFRL